MMRKRPTQQRAILIVEDILQATQICIAQQGLEHITTPKISEKSGVSVGSIYQYFENKDQIIHELLKRKCQSLGLALKQIATTEQQLTLEQLIPFSIQFGFDAMRSDQGFFSEILKHWHSYADSEAAQILERHFFEVGLLVFNRFFRHWDFQALQHKSFIIINSTLFTMMRYVSHRGFLISEQQLKAELTEMILAYLKSSNDASISPNLS